MCFQKTHNRRPLHTGRNNFCLSRMWIHEDDAQGNKMQQTVAQQSFREALMHVVLWRASAVFWSISCLRAAPTVVSQLYFCATLCCYGIRTLSQPNSFCFVRLSWHQIWCRIHWATACSVPAPTQHHQIQQHSAVAKPLCVQYLSRLFQRQCCSHLQRVSSRSPQPVFSPLISEHHAELQLSSASCTPTLSTSFWLPGICWVKLSSNVHIPTKSTRID